MTDPIESEATKLYHAAQRPSDFYISTEQNARIAKEVREHNASSFRKNVVLLSTVILCMSTGTASLYLFLSSEDERTRDKAISFGTASISFLGGLIGGSQL